MSERSAPASAGVALPDRVTVLTCIGCGAMGREERCQGACSEHKLPLVRAADYDALLVAAHAARERAARLAPVVRECADTQPADAREALTRLRERARRALRDTGADGQPGEWDFPDTVTGWWCAECGNVDMPQPCIGVCVWRPAEWVNRAVYEHQRELAEPGLHAARSLGTVAARLATVTPRDGEWQRNLDAFRAQARAALEDYLPDSPAPEAPPAAPPPDPEPVVQIHLWPR